MVHIGGVLCQAMTAIGRWWWWWWLIRKVVVSYCNTNLIFKYLVINSYGWMSEIEIFEIELWIWKRRFDVGSNKNSHSTDKSLSDKFEEEEAILKPPMHWSPAHNRDSLQLISWTIKTNKCSVHLHKVCSNHIPRELHNQMVPDMPSGNLSCLCRIYSRCIPARWKSEIT